MNKQEIIDAINELDDLANIVSLTSSAFGVVHGNSLRMAISALEKQIPKPIVGIKAQLQNRYCPSCNEWMFFDKYGQAKYCPTCGQSIDWRNEDE